MNEDQTTNSTNFKVAPLPVLVLGLALLILTVLFTVLTVGTIDFSKVSSSLNTPTTPKDTSQTTLPVQTNTNTDQPLTATDLAAAKQVSDAYIADLQQGKTDDAFKLESSLYQKTRSERPEMLHPSLYVPSSTPAVDGQSSGKTVDGYPDFVIVYRFKEGDGSDFYIQVLVDKLGGTWHVHGFVASPTHLKPSY